VAGSTALNSKKEVLQTNIRSTPTRFRLSTTYINSKEVTMKLKRLLMSYT
jgi:hypothetical protein